MKGWLISKPDAGARFSPPEDGWVQILAIGDWPNDEAGLVQVCDQQAFDAIMQDFGSQASSDNWPGMLVDYDHFSHHKDKASGAAGWADKLEQHGEGLWAHVRFSESGERAVRGGEYRLISPVLTGFEEVEGDRKRPSRLYRLALTNDPEIKGMAPVSNRAMPHKPKETDMDYKSELITLLGLPEGASDDDITAARTKLADEAQAFNRAQAEAEAERKRKSEHQDEDQIEALNRRVAELETELVERDVAQFDSLLGDNKEAKQALRELAGLNRASVSLVMTAIKPAKKTDTETSKPALPPLFNRRVQVLPQVARGEESKPMDDLTATRTRLRAQKVLAMNRGMGMTWSQAWDIARREVAAGAPEIKADKAMAE
jgi:hypothetical protein